MLMQTLILVRHGQNEDNAKGILNGHRDKPLTTAGVEQIKKLAKKLKKYKINAIISSPLKRAKQTADLIAESSGVNQVFIDDNLMERDYGVLTGRPREEKYKIAREIVKRDIDYFIGVDESEELEHAFPRAAKALSDIQKTYPNKTVLISGHGDIIQLMRAAYYKWDWRKALEAPYLKNGEALILTEGKEEQIIHSQ